MIATRKLSPIPKPRTPGAAGDVAAVGALALWRQRMREGRHGQDLARPATWRMDALYWAACREAWAFEELRSAHPNMAASLFADAADVLVKAARRKLRAEPRRP